MTTQKIKRIENMKEKSRDLGDKTRRSNMHQIKFPGENEESRGQALLKRQWQSFLELMRDMNPQRQT